MNHVKVLSLLLVLVFWFSCYGIGEVGKQIMAARAGATQITVNNNAPEASSGK